MVSSTSGYGSWCAISNKEWAYFSTICVGTVGTEKPDRTMFVWIIYFNFILWRRPNTLDCSINCLLLIVTGSPQPPLFIPHAVLRLCTLVYFKVMASHSLDCSSDFLQDTDFAARRQEFVIMQCYNYTLIPNRLVIQCNLLALINRVTVSGRKWYLIAVKGTLFLTWTQVTHCHYLPCGKISFWKNIK